MTDALPYLQNLTTRLADGLARQPASFRDRHVAYLTGCQNTDGGFSGREGGSDLYYTAFGLRGLAVLDALSPEIADKAAGFLTQCLTREASVIDFFSLLYACLLVQAGGGPNVLAVSPADWPERVADLLESFRTRDGGYGKAPGATSGSTYHTFLVGLCYQLLGRAWPRAEAVAEFALSRRRDDGGFVEIAPMRRGGTNPTAAAFGILQLTDKEIAPDVRDGVVRFLTGMASTEGGLQANGRAPLADLLSTFTGVWTLAQLDALARLDASAVWAYVRGVDQPGGGFRGGLWDERGDVEYTFYGLGVVSMFS